MQTKILSKADKQYINKIVAFAVLFFSPKKIIILETKDRNNKDQIIYKIFVIVKYLHFFGIVKEIIEKEFFPGTYHLQLEFIGLDDDRFQRFKTYPTFFYKNIEVTGTTLYHNEHAISYAHYDVENYINNFPDMYDVSKNTNNGQDFKLLYLEFLNHFYDASKKERQTMIERSPLDFKNKTSIVYLAATAHKLAIDYNLNIPSWIFEDRCYLPKPNTRPDIYNVAPEFEERNLFVSKRILERV
jgi:hypothetical protein